MRYRIEILTPEGAFRFKAGPNEFILDAAREAGCPLAAMCVEGWCVTCAGRLIEGEVDHSKATRYFAEDREAGFVLLCTAMPRSDLKIQSHQAQAMSRHRASHGLPSPPH